MRGYRSYSVGRRYRNITESVPSLSNLYATAIYVNIVWQTDKQLEAAEHPPIVAGVVSSPSEGLLSTSWIAKNHLAAEAGNVLASSALIGLT
jgi:hypothetical protein